MAQEATQLEVPNFEATTDGKKIFTPKQWLERFRQYMKGKYHYSGVSGKAFQNSENVGQKLGNAWATFVVHN